MLPRLSAGNDEEQNAKNRESAESELAESEIAVDEPTRERQPPCQRSRRGGPTAQRQPIP